MLSALGTNLNGDRWRHPHRPGADATLKSFGFTLNGFGPRQIPRIDKILIYLRRITNVFPHLNVCSSATCCEQTTKEGGQYDALRCVLGN